MSLPLLRYDAEGEDVARLQRLLNILGEQLDTTSKRFGPKTKAAVERFQQKYRLQIDGEVGRETWNVLQHEAAKRTTFEPKIEIPVLPEDLIALGKRILDVADDFVGLSETVQNAKWDDLSVPGQDEDGLRLRQKLEEAGWQKGWPYCAAFVEACWRAAYAGRPELPTIAKALTPSVMQSFHNMEKLGRITKSPVPGAIFYLQKGSSDLGHAGLATAVKGDTFYTIEGNTSPSAGSAEADRNGDGVYKKSRKLSFVKTSGLWLRGFTNPFLA